MISQMDIFEVINEDYKIKNKIRLIELFAGIGSQAKALERLGADFEHYKVVEFDKYAVKSYNAVHGTNFETSDVTKIHASDLNIVDTDAFTYLLTYSFPCQDLSLAGKQRGMEKGAGTRSGLLWEVERLLDECDELPQVLLMENVPQVIGTKNKPHFDEWVNKLEQLGYSNYWEVLNAKDYGIPQNRERCFMISILGNYFYKFPNKIPLTLKLKDMLEDEVDEKYYLSNERIEGMKKTKFNVYSLEKSLIDKEGISRTILARFEGAPQCVEVEPLPCAMRGRYGENGTIKQQIEVNNSNNANAITTVQKDSMVIETIQIPEKTKRGYAEATEGDGVYINRPHQKRCCVQKGMIQTIKTSCSDVGVVVKDSIICEQRSDEGIRFFEDDLCGALRTKESGGDKRIIEADEITNEGGRNRTVNGNLRIRKLTPLECWRLMGFDDEDCYKASQVNSNAQLYKQAGNSIVVDVLEAIFKQLL